jgi:hypothetical protein
MAMPNEVGQHLVLPLIEHLARVGRRTADGPLSVGGLRPRHLLVLKRLSEQGPTSQRELVTALSLDPTNVVGLLNELEERELITRRRDRADRRRHRRDLVAIRSALSLPHNSGAVEGRPVLMLLWPSPAPELQRRLGPATTASRS